MRGRRTQNVENLSLFALIYLARERGASPRCWESFITRLDILNWTRTYSTRGLRIFHYSPWYTYLSSSRFGSVVENLSLFTLIYLLAENLSLALGWESFIIRLDILTLASAGSTWKLRIFHYSPWYTYALTGIRLHLVENLSLFALIYLAQHRIVWRARW